VPQQGVTQGAFFRVIVSLRIAAGVTEAVSGSLLNTEASAKDASSKPHPPKNGNDRSLLGEKGHIVDIENLSAEHYSAVNEPFGELISSLSIDLETSYRRVTRDILPKNMTRNGPYIIEGPPPGTMILDSRPGVEMYLSSQPQRSNPNNASPGDVVLVSSREDTFYTVHFHVFSGQELARDYGRPEVAIPDGMKTVSPREPLASIAVQYTLDTPYPTFFDTRSWPLMESKPGLKRKILDFFNRIATSRMSYIGTFGTPFETGHPEFDRFVKSSTGRDTTTDGRIDISALFDDLSDVLLGNLPFWTGIHLAGGGVSWKTQVTHWTNRENIRRVVALLPRLLEAIYVGT
jgi:hypothetical protein